MWRVIALASAAAAACGSHLADPHLAGNDAAPQSDSGSRGGSDAMADAAPPACPSGRAVYLNFDGVTLVQGASDAPTNHAIWLGVNQAQIPIYKAMAADRLTQIAQVTAAVKAGLAQFPAIAVVTTRPASGPYVMIVFGGTPQLVQVPYIDAVNHLDCGDTVKSDVGIVFDDATPATPQKAADYAIGAIGFGLGLTGTRSANDCMCGWLSACTPGAGPCTLAPTITADLRCSGQANPQHEVAAFQAFCQ